MSTLNTQSLSTQELTLMVERSIGKTSQISYESDSKKVLNTQVAELPISLSVPAKLNKETVLDGGITNSASVTIGEDNIVYANVRVSADLNNALSIKDDGLYVSPSAGGGEGGSSVALLGSTTPSNSVNITQNVVSVNTRVSAADGNTLSVNEDGLFVPASDSGISTADVEQIIENKKTDYVLRDFGGISFAYQDNSLLIRVNGIDKLKISAQGVDFIV